MGGQHFQRRPGPPEAGGLHPFMPAMTAEQRMYAMGLHVSQCREHDLMEMLNAQRRQTQLREEGAIEAANTQRRVAEQNHLRALMGAQLQYPT